MSDCSLTQDGIKGIPHLFPKATFPFRLFSLREATIGTSSKLQIFLFPTLLITKFFPFFPTLLVTEISSSVNHRVFHIPLLLHLTCVICCMLAELLEESQKLGLAHKRSSINADWKNEWTSLQFISSSLISQGTLIRYSQCCSWILTKMSQHVSLPASFPVLGLSSISSAQVTPPQFLTAPNFLQKKSKFLNLAFQTLLMWFQPHLPAVLRKRFSLVKQSPITEQAMG